MPDPDLESRVSALEARVEEVAADASAARHLAAANDRDYADLSIKVDANRRAINALGEQNAARFDRLEGRFTGLEGRFTGLEQEMHAGFAQVDENFARVRAVLDQQAAGQHRIAELLTGLIERGDDR
jgi:hypothetical protein